MRRLLRSFLCVVVLLLPAVAVAAKSTQSSKTRPAPDTKPSAPPVFTDSQLGPAANLDAPGQKKASDEAQKIAASALAAFKKGDLVGAKKDFEKVLELAPGNPSTLINLGLIEYRLKHYPAAEKWLTQAVRSAPDAGLAWLILGIIAYDSDRLDAALAALAQAVLLEPKDPRSHHYLGVTIGKKGWYSGAEEEMRKAIELDPNYAEAHFNLAVFYLQRVPPATELARRHYQKAIALGAAEDEAIAKTLGEP